MGKLTIITLVTLLYLQQFMALPTSDDERFYDRQVHYTILIMVTLPILLIQTTKNYKKKIKNKIQNYQKKKNVES